MTTEELIQAAEDGNSRAAAALGGRYYKEHNYEEALHWMSIASAAGEIKAMVPEAMLLLIKVQSEVGEDSPSDEIENGLDMIDRADSLVEFARLRGVESDLGGQIDAERSRLQGLLSDIGYASDADDMMVDGGFVSVTTDSYSQAHADNVMFVCPSCGKSRPQDSAFCRYCGSNAVPVPSMGTTSDSQHDVSDDFTDVAMPPVPPTPAVQTPLNSAWAQAKQPATTPLNNAWAQAKQPVTPQPASVPANRQMQVPVPSHVQTSFSTSDLWSWLKKDEHRQIFYDPDKAEMTEQEYIAMLSERLKENHIMAELVCKPIRWDVSNYKKSYVVQTHTQAVNPLTCLIQFAHVGDFTFVEQKTFLSPPNLPPVPGSKVAIPANGIGLIIAGVVGFFLTMLISAGSSAMNRMSSGLYGYGYGGSSSASSSGSSGGGLFFILISLVVFCIGCWKVSQHSDAVRHNLAVDKAQKAWDRAWDRWANAIEDTYNFQETTDGQVSRLYLAVFETMKQVNEKLFPGVKSIDEHEQLTMNDITSQISRRKASYH